MPRFAEQLPEQPPSDPAREGTCAAWVAERVLKGEAERAADLLGQSHENGWLVEEEMVYYVQGYIDHLISRGGRVFAENKVRLNSMIAGTPDAFAILDEAGVLYADDLKYGFGIVSPYRNTQVSIYAGAIIRATLSKTKIRKVVIGIYQPRAFHPDGIYRTWEVWPEELMKFVHWIEERGQACQDLQSDATPGFHCDHCPAAASCVALTHSVYKGFRVLTDENQVQMNGTQMARELEFLNLMEKMLKARKSAVETEAKVRIDGGDYVPGWGYEQRFGTRKFTANAADIAIKTGLDPYTEPKLCTPAELIRRGASEEVVNGMSTRPRIQPKLVKRDDSHFKRLFEGKDDK